MMKEEIRLLKRRNPTKKITPKRKKRKENNSTVIIIKKLKDIQDTKLKKEAVEDIQENIMRREDTISKRDIRNRKNTTLIIHRQNIMEITVPILLKDITGVDIRTREDLNIILHPIQIINNLHLPLKKSHSPNFKEDSFLCPNLTLKQQEFTQKMKLK